MKTVRLVQCDTLQQAHYVYDMLQQAGINCMITNEVNSTLMSGIGFVYPEIWVYEGDYERAYAIYNDIMNNME